MKRTIVPLFLAAFPYLSGAPADSRQVQELRSEVIRLTHQLRNQEEALQTLTDKWTNQEAILESFGKKTETSEQSSRQDFQRHQADLHVLEGKFQQIESHLKALAQDIRSLSKSTSEINEQVLKFSLRLNQLETASQNHGENHQHLQAALKSVIDALQPNAAASDGKTYQVKSGDTLGTIALKHKTTVNAIKELNHLTHDRIQSGQILRIP